MQVRVEQEHVTNSSHAENNYSAISQVRKRAIVDYTILQKDRFTVCQYFRGLGYRRKGFACKIICAAGDGGFGSNPTHVHRIKQPGNRPPHNCIAAAASTSLSQSRGGSQEI
eukprot:363203-Chlamydomonas_euryale.AAC.22